MGVLQAVVRLAYPLLCFSFTLLSRWFSALVNYSLRYMDFLRTENPRVGNSVDNKVDSDEEKYDSTWEDDIDQEGTTKSNIQRSHRQHRNMFAARDMQNFRHMCPDDTINDGDDEDMDELQEESILPNLSFYKNERTSNPDDFYIDNFHKEWFGDYKRLEWVHTYIQWLFPIQEQGMNYNAYVLTPKEIVRFRQNKKVKERLLMSYELMLDFYGIKLLDKETGEVDRAENWKQCFENLNRNTHNNLRITRILKCLGILGFQHYQAPLVRFFLKETLVNGTLPRVKQSVLDYFMFAVLDKSKRKELIRFAFENFKPKEKFVWCPLRIYQRFLREMESTTQKLQNTGTDPSECARNVEKPELESQHLVQNTLDNNMPDENGNQNPDKITDDKNITKTYQDYKLHPLSFKASEGHERTSDAVKTLDSANGHSGKMSVIQKNGIEGANNMSEDISHPHQELGFSHAATEKSADEHSTQPGVHEPVSSDEMHGCNTSNEKCTSNIKEEHGTGENGENGQTMQKEELHRSHTATEEALSEADKNRENDSCMERCMSVADNKNVSVGSVATEKHNENESTTCNDVEIVDEVASDKSGNNVETAATSGANDKRIVNKC